VPLQPRSGACSLVMTISPAEIVVKFSTDAVSLPAFQLAVTVVVFEELDATAVEVITFTKKLTTPFGGMVGKVANRVSAALPVSR